MTNLNNSDRQQDQYDNYMAEQAYEKLDNAKPSPDDQYQNYMASKMAGEFDAMPESEKQSTVNVSWL